MSWVKSIKKRYFQKTVQKRLPGHATKHVKQPINLTKAIHIAILFDGTQPQNQQTVFQLQDKLTKQGKKVELLAYIHSKDPKITCSCNFISRRNLNWCDVPTGQLVHHFTHTHFDLLITLSVTPDLPAPIEYISLFSRATMRIGPYQRGATDSFDLMVDVKNQQNLPFFIDEVFRILQLVNH